MRKQNGFSLAEVLITLGLIGVLAGITLPMVNKTKPNVEMITLKKSYYNIVSTVAELINNEDLYPERDDDENCPTGQTVCTGFANISIKDLLGGDNEAQLNGNTYSGNSKFCDLFAAKLNATNISCSETKALSAGGNFKTADGVVWSMPVGDFSGANNYIAVDVNGTNKGNSCTFTLTTSPISTVSACGESVAPDIFIFNINRFGSVTIMDPVANMYIQSNKTTKTFKEIVKECGTECVKNKNE